LENEQENGKKKLIPWIKNASKNLIKRIKLSGNVFVQMVLDLKSIEKKLIFKIISGWTR
jgi:hypothetical protein